MIRGLTSGLSDTVFSNTILNNVNNKEREVKNYGVDELSVVHKKIDINYLKDVISLTDWCEYLGIKKDNGNRFHCPFHPPDKNGSFVVYERSNIVYDFHDNKFYDHISLYITLTGKTFKEALSELCLYAGLDIKLLQYEINFHNEKYIENLQKKKEKQKIWDELNQNFLNKIEHIQENFYKIKGYYLDNKLYKDLGYIDDNSWMHPLKGRLIIAWRDIHGDVIGLIGRSIKKNETPKYKYYKILNNEEFSKSKANLFNAHNVLNCKHIVIVEGILDALVGQLYIPTGSSMGIVATGGVVDASILDVKTIKIFPSVKNVIFTPDNDFNGKNGFKTRMFEKFMKNNEEYPSIIAEKLFNINCFVYIPSSDIDELCLVRSQHDKNFNLYDEIDQNKITIREYLERESSIAITNDTPLSEGAYIRQINDIKYDYYNKENEILNSIEIDKQINKYVISKDIKNKENGEYVYGNGHFYNRKGNGDNGNGNNGNYGNRNSNGNENGINNENGNYYDASELVKLIYNRGDEKLILKKISLIQSPIEQEKYIKLLSATRKINYRTIKSEIELIKQQESNSAKKDYQRIYDVKLYHPSYDVDENISLLGFAVKVFSETKGIFEININYIYLHALDKMIKIEDETSFDIGNYIGDNNYIDINGIKKYIISGSKTCPPIEKYWDERMVEQLYNGSIKYPNVKYIYEKIKEIFKTHIYFEKPIQYSIIACYVLLTYLHRCFDSIPFIFVYGPKGTGKSHLLSILEALCFNAVKCKGITVASMGDTIDNYRGTMIIDQAEELSLPQNVGTIGLIADSYNVNGGKRRFINKDAKTGARIVQEIETYSPKIFASIRDIDDDIKDRCILITMTKSDKMLPKPNFNDPIFLKIRDSLYKLFLKIGSKLYINVRKNKIYTKTREDEIIAPLKKICEIFDIDEQERMEMEEYMRHSASFMQAEINDDEKILFESLIEIANNKKYEKNLNGDTKINVKDLEKELKDKFSKPLGIRWITSKMKQYGLICDIIKEKNVFSVGGSKYYVINKTDIELKYEKYFFNTSNDNKNNKEEINIQYNNNNNNNIKDDFDNKEIIMNNDDNSNNNNKNSNLKKEENIICISENDEIEILDD